MSVLYPLAHLGLARAAMLMNDPAAARREYAVMLSLWKDADSSLEPVKQARQEQSKITDD